MLQAEQSGGVSTSGTYGGYYSSWSADIPSELRWDSARLNEARELSWKIHGKKILFYLPGMYVRDGVQGQYPALSITGANCRQQCAHFARLPQKSPRPVLHMLHRIIHFDTQRKPSAASA